jgi:hypothetical protein
MTKSSLPNEVLVQPTVVDPAVATLWQRMRFFYWGILLLCCGFGLYSLSILLSIFRLLSLQRELFVTTIQKLLWISGVPTTLGILLVALDLGLLLPVKRRTCKRNVPQYTAGSPVTVALTAYNDAESIFDAVRDFTSHPLVRRVIVVSNNSTDQTVERAKAAGAIVYNEPTQGYGACVYRCFQEALACEDTDLIVLCEGDLTFRAGDLDKLLAYAGHAEIVNGTRIVEQLREYRTQLSTFMWYGNFFVGKLLEAKHLGRGTFTDVGTTYKLIHRTSLAALMAYLDPKVNLEFNAHFLDRALEKGFVVVECPITFHSRVGESKGGNVNNLRALKVGLRMILGLSFGWRAR